MDYDELCNTVLRLDEKIRFAGISDQEGEIIHGGLRDGVESFFDSKETRESLRHAISRMGSRNSLIAKIGRVKYALVEYEKVKRISVPIDPQHVLFVSMDTDVDHCALTNNIIEIKEQKIKEDFSQWT